MAASPFKITIIVEPYGAGSGGGDGWQPQAAAATTPGGKWCCICGKSLARHNLNPTCGACFDNAVSLLPADLQLPPWAGAVGRRRSAPPEAPPADSAAVPLIGIPPADAAAPADDASEAPGAGGAPGADAESEN